MKKLFLGLTAGAAVFTLAACSESGESAQDIFDKTMERQQDITSASATMDMTQDMTITVEGEKQNMTTKTTGEMDMIMEPLAMSMDAEMSMNVLGQDMTMPLKMYMNKKQGFYMQDPTSNSWMKLPEDQMDAMLQSTEMPVNQTEQLEQLKEFVSDFEFEEADGDYVLTLNLDDEKFNSLIKEQALGALGDMGDAGSEEEVNKMLDGMEISDGMYKLTIDKKTYDLTDMVMDFVMTMDVEGETMTMDTNTNISYTDFNHLDAIEIPQEVIDTAVDATEATVQ